MSADYYPPGTVAMLRSPLGQEFMAVRTKGGDSGDYWSAPMGWPLGVSTDECDVRPLVVVDAHRFDPELLVRALRTKTGYTTLADAIEAQTRPPKPPEPTGHYAVVKDEDGLEWVLADPPTTLTPWKCLTLDRWSEYDSLRAVKVLSEGVQP